MNESIGALWMKKDKNGNMFFSGVINGVQVVVFQNKYKQSAKHPDYKVFPVVKQDKQEEDF